MTENEQLCKEHKTHKVDWIYLRLVFKKWVSANSFKKIGSVSILCHFQPVRLPLQRWQHGLRCFGRPTCWGIARFDSQVAYKWAPIAGIYWTAMSAMYLHYPSLIIPTSAMGGCHGRQLLWKACTVPTLLECSSMYLSNRSIVQAWQDLSQTSGTTMPCALDFNRFQAWPALPNDGKTTNGWENESIRFQHAGCANPWSQGPDKLISKRFGWFFILFIVKKHRWTGILGQTNTRTNRLSISTWLSVRTLCFTVWCCLLSYCFSNPSHSNSYVWLCVFATWQRKQPLQEFACRNSIAGFRRCPYLGF